MDYKLDGVRVQVHRAGEEVRIFTRSLDDITARLPEVAVAQALPHDQLCSMARCSRCVATVAPKPSRSWRPHHEQRRCAALAQTGPLRSSSSTCCMWTARPPGCAVVRAAGPDAPGAAATVDRPTRGLHDPRSAAEHSPMLSDAATRRCDQELRAPYAAGRRDSAGSRSSRDTPSTSSSPPRSGGMAAGRDGSPTSTSPRVIRRPGS